MTSLPHRNTGMNDSICYLGSTPAISVETAISQVRAGTIAGADSWMNIPNIAVAGHTYGDILDHLGQYDTFLNDVSTRARGRPDYRWNPDESVNLIMDLLDTPSGGSLVDAIDWMFEPELLDVEPTTRGPFGEDELFMTTDSRVRRAQTWHTNCTEPTCRSPTFSVGQMPTVGLDGRWTHVTQSRLARSNFRPLHHLYDADCKGCAKPFTEGSLFAVNIWYANPRHLTFLEDGTPVLCDQSQSRSTCRGSIKSRWPKRGGQLPLSVS
jgi:hypothetical protein